MINITDKSKCCGCYACVQRCPKQCIAMQEDYEGFYYPHVDLNTCIDCGLCEKVCPVLNKSPHTSPINFYAAINNNQNERINSSSGGVFSSLAEFTISNQGVVFGAQFNEQWNVEHGWTETKEGLQPFRGSKYVQSQITKTYIAAEDFLKAGRLVLFTGSGCQIAGLKRFLRKDYDNLYTVDFLCHGVPSPLIWRSYLQEILRLKETTSENHLNSHSIERISFRDKTWGWKQYGFSISLKKDSLCNQGLDAVPSANHYLLYESKSRNIYLKGFLANIFLRPSCHDCPSLAVCSSADITIGDLWGAEMVCPDLNDDKGISLVITNNEKGDQLLHQLNNITKKQISKEQAISQNPVYNKHTRINQNRSRFFADFKRNDADSISLIQKYAKQPFTVQVRSFVIACIVKVGLLGVIKRIIHHK